MERKTFQFFSACYAKATNALYQLKSRQAKFIDVYHMNGFGGEESVSGPGSSLEQTRVIRRELPKLLKQLEVTSLLDAPCGDFYWMQELDLGIKKYIGLDIVTDIIKINQQSYGNSKREFKVIDVVKDKIPSADVILSRDLLVHLTLKEIFSTLRNFCISNSKYLLTTTFTNVSVNTENITGWRPLNLQQDPFNFPEPLMIINEECSEQNGKYSDKCLGLWRLDEVALTLNKPRRDRYIDLF